MHWAMIRPSAYRPLYERGVRVLSSYYCPDGKGSYDINYRMDDTRSAYLSKHDALVDFDSGIVFTKDDIICNSTPVEKIVPLLAPLTKDPNQAEIMSIITHEQYFWPFYKAYLPRPRPASGRDFTLCNRARLRTGLLPRRVLGRERAGHHGVSFLGSSSEFVCELKTGNCSCSECGISQNLSPKSWQIASSQPVRAPKAQIGIKTSPIMPGLVLGPSLGAAVFTACGVPMPIIPLDTIPASRQASTARVRIARHRFASWQPIT